ncbi:peptidase C15 pyroglutamyl peptidase I [Stanieria cyanosphaera PCC 7437]|uniref:Peptidase C15 pyroglutamyl peptidase I n=1 Tax=Stanieria cyanosphaera (strain ATCC 29371 / PCC 7437) TaxID=111780 RepID=K9XXM1_STAC7|nr:peptidase C15 [Stanieria cyanosphaera]AFZ36412.1 peptidase C15 pyroglutamyl peptidase I [Stanieria cyanosphaera PCC 7437]
MQPQLLLTSFQTWLPHQKSNSSDELLKIIQPNQIDYAQLSFVRRLPVNIQQAAEVVISKIEAIQPHGIICCGMAESRQQLTIESNANYQESKLTTPVDLSDLISQLSNTSISHDAGRFVCEGLYYQVLEYCRTIKFTLPCIFVHVPVLNPNNLAVIQADFQIIMKFISEKATLS